MAAMIIMIATGEFFNYMEAGLAGKHPYIHPYIRPYFIELKRSRGKQRLRICLLDLNNKGETGGVDYFNQF